MNFSTPLLLVFALLLAPVASANAVESGDLTQPSENEGVAANSGPAEALAVLGKGKDLQASDSQNADVRTSDSQVLDTQDSDTQGSDSQALDSQDSDSQLSDSANLASPDSLSPGSEAKSASAKGSGSANDDLPEALHEQMPPEMLDIGIEDKAGQKVAVDAVFRNQDGKEVRFGDYLGDERPVLLVPAYFQCPMLCSLILNGVMEGLKSLAWNTGEKFKTVVLSFDPSEGPALTAQKRENYLEDYGRHVHGDGFEFLTGNEEQIKKLTDSIGFNFRWDEASSQYAHSAGAFVINSDGTISRTMYGISFPERDLRLALTEAGEGKVGSAWERVLLFCYHYDPNARGYGLAAMRLMRAGGALTLLLLALGGFILSRRGHFSRDEESEETPPDPQEPKLPHTGRERTQAGDLS